MHLIKALTVTGIALLLLCCASSYHYQDGNISKYGKRKNVSLIPFKDTLSIDTEYIEEVNNCLNTIEKDPLIFDIAPIDTIVDDSDLARKVIYRPRRGYDLKEIKGTAVFDNLVCINQEGIVVITQDRTQNLQYEKTRKNIQLDLHQLPI